MFNSCLKYISVLILYRYSVTLFLHLHIALHEWRVTDNYMDNNM